MTSRGGVAMVVAMAALGCGGGGALGDGGRHPQMDAAPGADTASGSGGGGGVEATGTGGGGAGAAAGDSGSGGASGTAGAGGGGAAVGTGGAGTDGGSDAGAAGGECVERTLLLPRQTPELLLLLDRSASMQLNLDDQSPANPTEITKWSQVVPAIMDVTIATDATAAWGLKAFPEDGDQCGSQTVTERIDTPVAPHNAEAVNRSVALLAPEGNGTPTSAAVSAAAAYLATRPRIAPRYIVLVTDGQPTCAGAPGAPMILGTSEAAVAAVSAIDAAAQNGVHTFVVGVATNRPSAISVLNMLATAGREARIDPNPLAAHFYLASTRAELVTAIGGIAGRAQSCVVPLGSAAASPPDLVRVTVGGATVPRDQLHADGWDYTPDHGAVELFGAACDALLASPTAEVRVRLSC